MQKRTQQVHEKTHWKHPYTIRKPYTKHTRKTHTRNAETHKTGSQKRNDNTRKKNTQAHSTFIAQNGKITNMTHILHTDHTHHTQDTCRTTRNKFIKKAMGNTKNDTQLIRSSHKKHTPQM